MPTIKNILTKYPSKLSKISSTSKLDVEVLLSFIIKKPKEFLYAYPEYKPNKKQSDRFNAAVKRRLKNEPIAYITGEKEFYGLNFAVNKNTLIPRPETELMVDEAINKIKKSKKTILIDIGTGSGCIPISIIKNLPKNNPPAGGNQIQTYAIDNSPKALTLAKKNARLHNIEREIKFIKNNLLKLSLINNTTAQNSNIIITANLPYISNSQYKKLPPDIKKYEPKNALIAGSDGLKYYRRLFKQIQKINSREITLLIEIDLKTMRLKAKIKKTIKQYLPNSTIEIKKDLRGDERMAVIKKKVA